MLFFILSLYISNTNGNKESWSTKTYTKITGEKNVIHLVERRENKEFTSKH